MYQTNSSHLQFRFAAVLLVALAVALAIALAVALAIARAVAFAFLVVIPEGDLLLLLPLLVFRPHPERSEAPMYFAFVPAVAHSAAGSPHTTTTAPPPRI
jgi:hypothetical protein